MLRGRRLRGNELWETFVGETTSDLMTCINDQTALNPCANECGFL